MMYYTRSYEDFNRAKAGDRPIFIVENALDFVLSLHAFLFSSPVQSILGPKFIFRFRRKRGMQLSI